MTVIPNARTIALANAMTDSKALVVCRDVFDVATIGTDFSFDAFNPLGYEAQAVPAGAAAMPAMQLAGIVLSGGGNGGTNGTFALGITGGGGAGAAGTFTVAGGAITSVTVTNPGSGYTSAPNFSVTASAGLTGYTLLAQMADVANVARDVQPALARTHKVCAGPAAGSYASRAAMNASGKGWKFVNAATTPFNLNKTGVLAGQVCQPYHEGFIDFVEVITFKADGFPQALQSPYFVPGSSGGFVLDGAFRPCAAENNGQLSAAPLAIGPLYTLGKRVRFNVGAGTSTIIGYLGMDGSTVVASASFAGKTTASYSTTNTAPAVLGSRDAGSGYAWHGEIFHLYREFIGISGRSDADVLELVQRIHTRAASRYA